MIDAPNDRFPRGAILVVVAGVILTILVAWASNEDLVSTKALPWATHEPEVIEAVGPLPFSEDGEIELTSTGFDLTPQNSAGERLFQVGAELRIDPGSSDGVVRARCKMSTEAPTVNARTPQRPAAFPGPTDDLAEAAWPMDIPVNHADQGSPYSTVTLPVEYGGYGSKEGVSVEWGDWRTGQQEWIWTVAEERPESEIRLRFVALWRSLEEPGVVIDCSAWDRSGGVELRTGSDLGD